MTEHVRVFFAAPSTIAGLASLATRTSIYQDEKCSGDAQPTIEYDVTL